MDKNFLELSVGTPKDFADFLQRDRANAGELIKRYGK
jgi:tripartite-type tricarboxylate transporter receptor subunit TctC